MSFSFTENVVLELPPIESSLAPFEESATHQETNKLIIEIAAIHEGLTANYNMYAASELEKALETWVQPYPKPILLNHDHHSDPMGRVMAASMANEDDGSPYVKLQAAVTKPDAIARVKDKRFLTGSIGGKADKALCSICGVDWAATEMERGLPCAHKRGKIYEGKLAYFELKDLKFIEYSFVNVPGDSKSLIRSVSESDGDWLNEVRVYSLDMNSPSIIEMKEGAGNNILDSMKKKAAHVTYMGLKGGYLSVSAFDYQESNNNNVDFNTSDDTIDKCLSDENNISTSSQLGEISEEEKMVKSATENEDILSIAEKLLSNDSETINDETDADESVSDEPATEVVEETNTEAEEMEETTSNDSAEEELVAEDSEGGAEGAPAEEEANESEESVDEEEAAAADPEESPEGSEDPTEPEVEESNSELDKLKEENDRMKSAFFSMLVESVVDAKIARGLAEAADKASLIEEHSTRTAASLADSLKDLKSQPLVAKKVSEIPAAPVAESTVAAEAEDITEELDTTDSKTVEVSESLNAEDHLYILLNQGAVSFRASH